MTVFKGFMVMVKRNIGMFVLYMGIFLVICVMLQVLTKGQGMENFEEERLDIAVIDRDGGELAEGLTQYLGGYHNLVDVKDNKDAIQENLFYRNIYYVVTIPENFEKSCLDEGKPLRTTKIPGTFSAYYVDQQIDTFINDVRIFKAAGFDTQEAVKEVKKAADTKTEVTMIDKNGHGGQLAQHAYMFQFMPYAILSILCYIIGFAMIAYREKNVRRRMLCSAFSSRKQNAQLVLGYLVIGISLWVICMIMPVVMYQTEFLSDPNLIYYLVNSFLVTLVGLAIAFLIGVVVENAEVVNGVVNVVTLGMCFLCGAFVSLSVLGDGVKMIASFFPLYWYEVINGVIAENVDFTHSQQMLIYKGFGIQALFAVAILCVGLVVSKHKEVE